MKSSVAYLLTISILLAGCNQKNANSAQTVKLKNGENILRYDNDSIHRIFYVTNNSKNGAALELNNNGSIQSMGTYKDDKKEGIWFGYKNGVPVEYYFENGVITAQFDGKVFFHLYRDEAVGYALLIPNGWDTILSNEKVVKFGYSKLSKSVPPPNFSVSTLSNYNDDISKLMSDQITDLSSLPNFKIIKKYETSLIYTAKWKKINAVSFNKLIRTKSNYLLLSCLCREEDYTLYSFVFNTMLISFNTIN